MSSHPTEGTPVATPSQRDAALHTERMSRIDGCPNCVANYEAPQMIRPTVDGFRADYLCTDCRHEWTTSWGDR